jgi:hypothetical protein
MASGEPGSEGKLAMTGLRDRMDAGREGTETTLRFVMTLIVATLMVAVTAYVLSFAVLAPGSAGPTHGATAATQHVRT